MWREKREKELGSCIMPSVLAFVFLNRAVIAFMKKRRAKSLENVKEKFSVTVEGLDLGSSELRLTGGTSAQQEGAREYLKSTVAGIQCKPFSISGALAPSAQHAVDKKGLSGTVYCPPGLPTGLKPVTVTICGLGKKPVEEIEQLLSNPIEVRKMFFLFSARVEGKMEIYGPPNKFWVHRP